MSKNKGPKAVDTESTVAALCKCEGCKKPEATFTFCATHYEWFKFGLITKAGKKVMDFDKKWSHWEANAERFRKAA